MLTPSIGVCCTPLTNSGCGQARRLEDRRRDVDHVMELRADLALRLDALGPVHDRAVAGAAEVRSDLLGPLVRRVHRVRPAHRVVVVGLGAAELVERARQELRGFQLRKSR